MACDINTERKETVQKVVDGIVGNATSYKVKGNVIKIPKTGGRSRYTNDGRLIPTYTDPRAIINNLISRGNKIGNSIYPALGKLNWVIKDGEDANSISVKVVIPSKVNQALEVKYGNKTLDEANRDLQDRVLEVQEGNQFIVDGQVYPSAEDAANALNNNELYSIDNAEVNQALKENNIKRLKNDYFPDSDESTVYDVLLKIANNNHPLSDLANHLLQYANINNTDIILRDVEYFGSPGTAIRGSGQYNPNTNEIQIAGKSGVRKIEALLLHEILHALSVDALRDNNEFTESFRKIYEKSIEKLGKYNDQTREGVYANYTIDEFFVGIFTDAKFIIALQSVEAIDTKKYRNLFEEIMDYILNVLGLNKTDNLYNQAVSVASNILEYEKQAVNRMVDQSYYDALSEPMYSAADDQFFQVSNIFTSVKELEGKLANVNKTVATIGSDKKLLDVLKKAGLNAEFRSQFLALIKDNPELRSLKLSTVLSSYLKEFVKSSNQQYYKAIQEPLSEELDNLLIRYFDRFHIRREELDNLKDRFGVDSVGVFDVLAKTIYYSKNRNLLTLPEEYGHVFVELLGSIGNRKAGNPLFQYMFNNIESWDGYKRVYRDYKDVYVTAEGNTDLYKIKKEAIGQAIGIALVRNYKVKKGGEEFWSKVQEIIDYIINLVKGVDYVSLNTTIDSIAKDILQKNYSKLDRLQKDTSNYNLLSYSETIKEQNKKDGGKALEFMKWFTDKGMIITGSLAYRLQGTVYRPELDALHDIDNIVPFDVHGISLKKSDYMTPEELESDALYRKYSLEGNYAEAKKYKVRSSLKLDVNEIVDRIPALRELKEKYPDTDFLYSFYNEKANSFYITLSAINSVDPSLRDRFKSYTGNFNERLSNFTEEELSKIYLFDFFLRPQTHDQYSKVVDREYGLALAHFNYAFYEKLNTMGRAKDAFDYQNWNYFDENNIMAPDFSDRLVYFQLPPNKNDSAVNYALKSVDILNNLTDKQKQDWNKWEKGTITSEQLLDRLQIPKEQKSIVLDSLNDNKTPEQVALDIASKYAYTVEINTGEATIEKVKEVQTNISKYYSPSEDRYYRYTDELGWISSDKDNKNQEHDVTTPEDLEPFEYNSEYLPVMEQVKSNYYSNLTVPGGTNYTENEIATPSITPSIKGHAQFATDKGIGWFRSDEKQIPYFIRNNVSGLYGDRGNAYTKLDEKYSVKLNTGEIYEIKEVFNDFLGENYEQNVLSENPPNNIIEQAKKLSDEYKLNKEIINEGSKTRRILEVQSDLFQKGRNKKDLIGDSSYYEEGVGEMANIFENPPNDNQNQFLQLLNKDNNWVTFFVKSIMQDTAKQTITEVQESNVEAKVRELEREGLLEIDCKGKLKAEKGLQTNFTKGGKWKVYEIFEGKSHKQGGIDINIKNNQISFINKNGSIKAKYGLVIPKGD